MRASNLPTEYRAVGLPPGITCDAATGVISGVTSATGSFVVTLQAANANGVGTLTELMTTDGITPIEMPYIHRVMPPTIDTYHSGETLEIVLEVDAPYQGLVVTGTPRIALKIGDQTRYATYAFIESNGARPRLHFTYLIVAGDAAPAGIEIGRSIELNGGTIRDRMGLFCALDLPQVGTLGARVAAESSRAFAATEMTGD
jgi:hypothetical protein